jgi:hypothetical protein
MLYQPTNTLQSLYGHILIAISIEPSAKTSPLIQQSRIELVVWWILDKKGVLSGVENLSLHFLQLLHR